MGQYRAFDVQLVKDWERRTGDRRRVELGATDSGMLELGSRLLLGAVLS